MCYGKVFKAFDDGDSSVDFVLWQLLYPCVVIMCRDHTILGYLSDLEAPC